MINNILCSELSQQGSSSEDVLVGEGFYENLGTQQVSFKGHLFQVIKGQSPESIKLTLICAGRFCENQMNPILSNREALRAALTLNVPSRWLWYLNEAFLLRNSSGPLYVHATPVYGLRSSSDTVIPVIMRFMSEQLFHESSLQMQVTQTIKRRVSSATKQGFCSHCKITETPTWRAGPLGKNTLCNACGLRYKKQKNLGLV
ncbi:MAG: hypothetical protein S4CHLAM123_04320 [Chlamydiales bacterium]|nr:hypothetical protein [Chlamydiales bacterium]